MFEGSEGDEADFFAKWGGFELGGGDARVESETPANLVGHPVADAGAGVLIEEKGFEGLLGMALDEFPNASEREF